MFNFSALTILLLVIVQFLTATLQTPQSDMDYAAYVSKYDLLRPSRYVKRAPHNIDTRALNQFKNCYFSPIQCVLMEKRRK
ncbi:unnamed protein product [Caenorhabditis angaria]|uniref:Uncharacterized protein n=1 Tax=Caenorhabditis angaria TaxID=860376 RepID=A0A9P1IPG0_9PELO|nr:unnamed protein product [Caenorhabditis angaria]